MSFTKKDFVVEWFSGSGAGGQHRNKHQNCCRIRHLESGLVAVGTDNRSRVANQRAAFKRLAGKLIAHYGLEESGRERRQSSEVVRTYHFVRSEMIDHGTGEKGPITDDEFDRMIEQHRFGDMSRSTGRQ